MFTDSQVYLFIAMQVHETVSDHDIIPESTEHGDTPTTSCNEAQKRLGLGLARSRSRLVAKIRHLGLVELQEGLGLGLVSDEKLNVLVSSRSDKLRSYLHPWLFSFVNCDILVE